MKINNRNTLLIGVLFCVGTLGPTVLLANSISELANQNARTAYHSVTGKLRFIGSSEFTPVTIRGVNTATAAKAAGMAAVKQYGPGYYL